MPSNLILQIEQLSASSSVEEATQKQFIQFIHAFGQNAFERSNLVGHLTASAWIICEETRESALLVHHVKLDKWLQPGGHADGDTDLSRVACTEVREETGLHIKPISNEIFDLDLHAIPARGNMPTHFHFDVRYLFLASQRLPLTVSHESRDVRWFHQDEIQRLGVDESVERMLRKGRAA